MTIVGLSTHPGSHYGHPTDVVGSVTSSRKRSHRGQTKRSLIGGEKYNYTNQASLKDFRLPTKMSRTLMFLSPSVQRNEMSARTLIKVPCIKYLKTGCVVFSAC